MKTCTNCNKEKELIFFSKNKSSKNGYNNWCKICFSNYYVKNKKNIDNVNSLYYQNNKENILSYQKEYYEVNKISKLEKQKIHLSKNKDKRNCYYRKYEKNKKIIDPSYKLRKNVSAAIYNAIVKNGSSKNNLSVLNYLSYSIEELKQHIETQFESWMSWNNWGVYNPNICKNEDQSTWTWQIDHIVPQSTLSYTSMKDNNFKICWNLDNLRPYSSKQNILDSNRKKNNV